jgi:hypothetical protein
LHELPCWHGFHKWSQTWSPPNLEGFHWTPSPAFGWKPCQVNAENQHKPTFKLRSSWRPL